MHALRHKRNNWTSANRVDLAAYEGCASNRKDNDLRGRREGRTARPRTEAVVLTIFANGGGLQKNYAVPGQTSSSLPIPTHGTLDFQGVAVPNPLTTTTPMPIGLCLGETQLTCKSGYTEFIELSGRCRRFGGFSRVVPERSPEFAKLLVPLSSLRVIVTGHG
jgi:hypothetical protein